jgi:hypothetical protein
MCSKNDIYHNQGIDGNIWARCISKGIFTKTNVPILRIMILFMEAHKCVFIMMQIGLAIGMTANPRQIILSYWEMVLLATQ